MAFYLVTFKMLDPNEKELCVFSPSFLLQNQKLPSTFLLKRNSLLNWYLLLYSRLLFFSIFFYWGWKVMAKKFILFFHTVLPFPPGTSISSENLHLQPP